MLKALLKTTIREDYWQYMSWYRGCFGFLPAVLGYIKLIRNKGMGVAPNPMTGESLFIRPGTADQDAYSEVFVARQYDVDSGDSRFIVDAGAHIGHASVFFASKYPQATVVAIEPEASNFALLLANTKRYPNIKPIQAGLWGRRVPLRIQDLSVATWSFRVAEDPSSGDIRAITIEDILSEFNVSQIDLLKIDIEGSELEVLNSAQTWIGSVRNLIVELHDRFRPGCADALVRALSGCDYERSESGEVVVISHLRSTGSQPQLVWREGTDQR